MAQRIRQGTTPGKGPGGAARDLSFPIGRVAGIEIRVHVTFLVLIVLFAAGSAGPNGPGALSGLAWLVIIFSCVLAHELAHSIVARQRGALVRAIVLLPIGGVSKLENLPEAPRDELAIAIVGPLTSYAIAVIAALGAAAAGIAFLPIDLYDGPFVHRLVWFNLLVGTFNLLPAFPLDGGRVLRSLLERRMDLEAATKRAASIGRLLAGVMVMAGLFVNFWLVVIGAFVYFGASTEEVATVIHARARGLRARDVMLHQPLTVDARMPIANVVDEMRYSAQRDFPVLSQGVYFGMLYAEAIAESSAASRTLEATDRSAPTLGPADPIEGEVMSSLLSGRQAAAVVEDGRVVGLLRRDDLMRVLTARHPSA
ncbi:MAG: site-2 protease family protein [Actinomycetota bacterium]